MSSAVHTTGPMPGGSLFAWWAMRDKRRSPVPFPAEEVITITQKELVDFSRELELGNQWIPNYRAEVQKKFNAWQTQLYAHLLDQGRTLRIIAGDESDES